VRPARIEKVVIFLPDVTTCMPNRLEYETIQARYKTALENLLAAKQTASDKKCVDAADEAAAATAAKENPVITISDNEVSAENVDSIKKSDQEAAETGDAAVDDAEVQQKQQDAETTTTQAATAAAVVVNPVSSITDKAL